jgi:hypothetical protein
LSYIEIVCLIASNKNPKDITITKKDMNFVENRPNRSTRDGLLAKRKKGKKWLEK